MSRFFEGASFQAEVMKQGFWSPEEIESMRTIAQSAWEKIKSSPSDLLFESAVQEAYPSLSEDERRSMGDELHERIAALAQREDASLTGKISPEELKHFIEIYLAE